MAKLARSAGSSVTLSGYDGDYAIENIFRETRKVSSGCTATIGTVSNPDQKNIKIGKAGRNRWRGKRPQTRGVAMNLSITLMEVVKVKHQEERSQYLLGVNL